MSTDLKERIEQMLAGLGDTPEAVAASLGGRNITGFTGDCNHCPVAVLIVDEFGGDWKVTEYSVTDVTVTFPGGQVETPDSVCEFISRFDNYEFPELIDPEELVDEEG